MVFKYNWYAATSQLYPMPLPLKKTHAVVVRSKLDNLNLVWDLKKGEAAAPGMRVSAIAPAGKNKWA